MENYVSQADILDESKDCFLTYAEEVLTDRAIPAVEDGLLSVHRKILWTMEDYMKMNSSSPKKKSASIVGTTVSTSYFHGDAACYGALCKMSLNYLMRYPLITGQGTLGTQDSNDTRAAMRYTEAKPSEFADLMMKDFKKGVVPLKETYNGEFLEPVVLPSVFPNALVNGKESIGVSMSHNSLPHNLNEVCDAILAYLKDKDNFNLDVLMKYIIGPDFPLGGVIINKSAIREAYATGKSKTSLKVRGDYVIESNNIVFTSIPYRTYRDKITAQIAENIDEISRYFDDYCDESNLGQNRLVFTLKPQVNAEQAVEVLFALTDLQTSLSINMNYIVDGTPKLCSMVDLVKEYCRHQTNVLIKAATYDKEQAESRVHILEGLIKAVDKIDEVIEIIKNSENHTEAKNKLMDFLSIDTVQVNAILDMKLGRLTRIEKEDLIKERNQKIAIIEDCTKVINDEGYRTQKLIAIVQDIKKYGDDRRTKLVEIDVAPRTRKKEVVKETAYITIEKGTFKINRNDKAPRGYSNNKLTIKTETTSIVGFLTTAGKIYNVAVHKLAIGDSFGSALGMSADEKILYALEEHEVGKNILFVTNKGMAKITPSDEYVKCAVKKGGTGSIKLKEGDKVAYIGEVIASQTIKITSKNKAMVELPVAAIKKTTGRLTIGNKTIDLAANDYVVSVSVK